MLELRVYGPAARLTDIGVELQARGSVRHAALAHAVDDGAAILLAEVDAGAADAALELVLGRGVGQEDVALTRLDDVGPIDARRRDASLIWADVIGQARKNARPVARYLVFMIAAGVIAAFGVIHASATLIVGAMAVSPDTLPVTAICAAILARRWPLARRATLTLVVGLGAACVTAAAVAALLDLAGDLPPGFAVDEAALAGLTTINSSTVAPSRPASPACSRSRRVPVPRSGSRSRSRRSRPPRTSGLPPASGSSTRRRARSPCWRSTWRCSSSAGRARWSSSVASSRARRGAKQAVSSGR